MRENSKYVIKKTKKKTQISSELYKKKLSYKLRYNDQDSNIAKNVNVYDDKLREKIINRKIVKKFKVLLELIASVCESDEDPGSGLMFALNEIERFKRELINKYVKFLNAEQIKLLDKKIKIIEEEVKIRMYHYNEQISKSMEINEKETHRRR